MLVIKMMTNKNEGYKVAGYANTVEDAKILIERKRNEYNAIDIYFEII